LARAAAGVVVPAALTIACGAADSPPARPNLVLVVLDALRADHLGAYGYVRPTSPCFDAIAARAALFEDASAPSSHTVTSMLSLFSGRDPGRHGNLYYFETNSFRAPQRRLRPQVAAELPLLADALSRAGYRSAAVVTNPWLRADYGFARGFERWVDLHGSDWKEHPRAEEVLAASRELLSEVAGSGSPFFLYLHFMDAHAPYRPAAAERGLFARPELVDPRQRPGPNTARSEADVALLRDRYDESIRSLDRALCALDRELDARGLRASTLLAITADHGEEFQEHGGLGHGHSLYEEVLRVPLVIAHPGLVPLPRRVAAPVASVDLEPTLLDAAGIAARADGDGRSLLPLLRDGANARAIADALARRARLSELGRLAALRRGSLKLIRARDGSRSEAFDLARDPAERTALGERAAEAAAWHTLEAELTARTSRAAPALPPAAPARSEPDFEARLRELGYAE
jgi:arylsulfatase A-like enzyme